MIGTVPSIRRIYVKETNKNRPKDKLEATTLTIHNTANPTSTAQNERDWLENPNNDRTASWHFAVDQKEAVVAIPEDEVAWHAGDHTGNKTSISIEVCESGDQNIVWKNAVGLAAYILVQRGWGVDKLRKHQDWSGKYCPRLIIPKWTQFVNDVQETINYLKAKIAAEKVINKGKVNANVLNIRTGQGTTFPVITQLGNGNLVDIYETKNGWHRIGLDKWIAGEYVTIVAEPKLPAGTPIMGKSIATPDQLYNYAYKTNSNPKLTVPLYELCKIFIEEGEAEGVRGDIAFCQSCKETGFFSYTGQARPEWNNYSGLGVTGQVGSDGIPLGNKFPDARTGIRAQIQHLKAYASNEPLKQACVDTRFSGVKRARVPVWEWLGRDENPENASRAAADRQGWAVPGPTYGHDIVAMFQKTLAFPAIDPNLHPKPQPEPVPEPKPVPQPVDWKTAGIEYLHSQGLLDDKEGWIGKKDEPMPVWATTIMLANIHKDLKKNIK